MEGYLLAHGQNQATSSAAVPFKKLRFLPKPSLSIVPSGKAGPHVLLCDEMLAGPVLSGSWRGNHSCGELVRAMAMTCLEDIFVSLFVWVFFKHFF